MESSTRGARPGETEAPKHNHDQRARRKRLGAGDSSSGSSRDAQRWFWAPSELNWWIGSLFALGATLFTLGSVMSLAPSLLGRLGLGPAHVNAVYFAGSLPFTTAAWLQLHQATTAPRPMAMHGHATPALFRRFGWRWRDLGWLSCALQFPGTVLFNFDTFDAMLPGLSWFEEDLTVWTPNIVGSILFISSGYLAFAETCRAPWGYEPHSLSWWVTFVNLLGCVGFLAAASFAYPRSGPHDQPWVTLSNVFTLQGALCFLVGSLLMLPEAAADPV